MSTASLGTRLKKLQAEEGGGLSLEQWAVTFARQPCAVPRHILVSFVAERMVPKHLTGAVWAHPLCVAWREGPEFRIVSFVNWLIARGTSVDAIVNEVRHAR